MAATSRRIQWIVTGAVAVAVLVLNPVSGVLSGPRFGAAELRAAVEGTWRLTVEGQGGENQTVTFRLAQGTAADLRQARAPGLVREAAACGGRSLVRSAGACMDETRMPLEVTLIAEGGEQRRTKPGEFRAAGDEFRGGELEVAVAEVQLRARVAPGGEVQWVSSYGAAGKPLPSTLVRIAR